MLHTSVKKIQNRGSLEQLRERFILALAILSILISVIGLIVGLLVGASKGTISFPAAVPTLLVLFAGSYVLWLVHRHRIDSATNIIVSLFLLGFLVSRNNEINLLLGTMSLIAASLLAQRWYYAGVNLIVFAKYAILLAQIVAEHGLTSTDDGSALVVQIAALAVITSTTRFFVMTTEETARQSQRTADLLQATSEVTQTTSKLLDLNELFRQATDLIRDRFGFYHVQIFMLDEARQYAVLVASTGRVGQQLLNKGHRLAVGSQSVIGRVTQLGEIVIARDTDTVHARNELLPSTRSELALPLLDGDQIIGALDVQSTRSDAFDSIDIQALVVMSNQLSTSIRNARLFQQQAVSVQENKRLFIEAETNLREIQRLNRELTKNAWQEYLEEQRKPVGITVQQQGAQPDAAWTTSMIEASRRLRPVRDPNGSTIAVPIVLRGEVIGAIEVEASQQMGSEDMVEIIQAVAQRLAVSLDNARLFEEAQQATLQEQRINAIVGRYQEATTVDELLQITLAELSESLGAQAGKIRLGVVPGAHSSNGGGTDA